MKHVSLVLSVLMLLALCATASAADDRVGVWYSAYNKNIVVDGKLDEGEWVTTYPNEISPNNPDWHNYHGRTLEEVYPDKFSGVLYCNWDEEYIYFAGIIKDDDVSVTDFWDCDYFGFYFDALGITQPGDPAWMDGHIWAHWRVNPDAQIPAGSEEVRALDMYMGRSGHNQVPGSKGERVFTDDGYTFEIMIPWKELAFLDEPYEGRETPFRILAYEVDLVLGGAFKLTSQYFWGHALDVHHEEFWHMGRLILVK